MPYSLPDPELLIPIAFRSAGASSPVHTRVENLVLEFFDLYRSRLLRYLYYLGLSEHDSEEVVQEAFLALFHHLRLGRNQRSMRAWLFRVTHNLGLKRRFALKRTTNLPDAETFAQQIDPALNPEQQLSARQRQERLLAVVEAMPEQDRCCLQMRAEGLRYREIAKALGISLSSVAQSLTRSLERLERVQGRL